MPSLEDIAMTAISSTAISSTAILSVANSRTTIALRVAISAVSIFSLFIAPARAEGLVKISRLSAALAHETVGEAVAACARNGYAVTAVVVTVDGVRQAVLRGDGAPVHTLDSAYAMAYAAASLVPVRKETSTKQLFERVSKNPGTTVSSGKLPDITFVPGGVAPMAAEEPIGGIGVGGAKQAICSTGCVQQGRTA